MDLHSVSLTSFRRHKASAFPVLLMRIRLHNEIDIRESQNAETLIV